MRIGLPYSSSQNACMIRFIGGPWDGKSGLFDHDHYAAIHVCYTGQKEARAYKRVGPKTYEMVERRKVSRRRADG